MLPILLSDSAPTDPRLAIGLALFSAVVASVTALYSARVGQHLEAFKARSSRELAEEAARRDYEYDARKKLYTECEPLLFQLHEAAFSLYWRVLNIGDAAIHSKLDGKDEEGANWLREGYYLRSTMYRVLAPAAILTVMQERLTFIDLRLDKRIARQYKLARLYYDVLCMDFDCANAAPSIAYEPNVPDWRERRVANPSRYQRQAFVRGRLERAIVTMLVRDSPGAARRIMSFGEFEVMISEPNSLAKETFTSLRDVFFEFNPTSRPVLWRVLTAAAIVSSLLRHDLLPTKLQIPVRDLMSEADIQCIRSAATTAYGDPTEAAVAVILKALHSET